MATAKQKNIYTMRNTYTDRAVEENQLFTELTVKIRDIDTAFLLLHSKEELVLIAVFKHITEYARKQDENIEDIYQHNLLDLLLDKQCFIDHSSVIVRRFALYLITALVEHINTLQAVDYAKILQVVNLALQYFNQESDNFCLEYLTVVINKCGEDPQAARELLDKDEFWEKLFALAANTDNPDIVLHSLQAIDKALKVMPIQQMLEFSNLPTFPIDRVLCVLTNEFPEIRGAALQVLQTIVTNYNDTCLLARPIRPAQMLLQLTTMFCDASMAANLEDVVKVLAAAMRIEQLAHLFIEQNLFDRLVECMGTNSELEEASKKCRVNAIFAELAQYKQFLQRLHLANTTDLLLFCLLQSYFDPPDHVLLGLNRMMKCHEAAKRIFEMFNIGVVAKLLAIILNKELPIKTREQAAELIVNLLVFAFHDTAAELFTLDYPNILANIFTQGLDELSIDFLISLLNSIENLAQNNEYRAILGEVEPFIKNLMLLLRNSFSSALLTSNLLRCLSTLIDEDPVRAIALATFLGPSLKRSLKSLANILKTAATNFIIRTTAFPELAKEYIDCGVFEVLIFHQKHSFCVPTWNPAIESILATCPTLKFCIRNHLGFTDSTANQDFAVSKKKFNDFRILQSMLNSDLSPMHPILVVNFERQEDPNEHVVVVPRECFAPEDMPPDGGGWCYCTKPGDSFLPRYLEELNEELEKSGLVENPPKVKRAIDFEHLAKRVKIIAGIVVKALSTGLQPQDLNSPEDCSHHFVKCHLLDLRTKLHCNFIPLGMVRSGCQFERAILFKALADQIGLPCTLQRSVDGRYLFNEVPLPVKNEHDVHCDKITMQLMPWSLLRPTHIVDLMYNIGELYTLQSRQALQYLRLN